MRTSLFTVSPEEGLQISISEGIAQMYLVASYSFPWWVAEVFWGV